MSKERSERTVVIGLGIAELLLRAGRLVSGYDPDLAALVNFCCA
jgi:hypothetical protein